jgi:hypothetical protein
MNPLMTHPGSSDVNQTAQARCHGDGVPVCSICEPTALQHAIRQPAAMHSIMRISSSTASKTGTAHTVGNGQYRKVELGCTCNHRGNEG